MAETLVDVLYQGLDVGKGLKLRSFGPTTAYLEHGAPLPVGTVLWLNAEDGVRIEAHVLRVHEHVSGSDEPAGMRVRALRCEGAEQSWWDERVSELDPLIPEPVLGEADDETPENDFAESPDTQVSVPPPDDAGAERTSRSTVMMTAEELAGITDQAESAGDSSDGESAKKKRRRRKKR